MVNTTRIQTQVLGLNWVSNSKTSGLTTMSNTLIEVERRPVTRENTGIELTAKLARYEHRIRELLEMAAMDNIVLEITTQPDYTRVGGTPENPYVQLGMGYGKMVATIRPAMPYIRQFTSMLREREENHNLS